MTEHVALGAGMGEVQLNETALDGPVPRYQHADWRTRYGVVAGITARGADGGAGFDLGLWTDQPVGGVMTRWRAFREAEPGFASTILGTQIHGAHVMWHEGGTGWVQVDGVDGHATARVGLLLTVTVADCIPVYLIAPARGAIALLHAGWRGTAGGILRAGVALLARHVGAAPDEILMHAGVGICGGCYEVGSEVVEAVGQQAGGVGPWHVDLRRCLLEQAGALGLGGATASGWCSAHDRPLFYSHRASHGADGRMVAYLGIPLPGASA